MTKSWFAASLLALAPLAAAGPARGQYYPYGGPDGGSTGNIAGFTVAGKGAVSARPNRLEIDMEVNAASELSSDAIVKYRDAKKRLTEAFVALKMANVAVEDRSLLVDQKSAGFNPYFGEAAPPRRGKIEVQLTRKLVVTCTEIRQMDEEALLQLVAKLLDVAQDAGGKVGGNNDMSYYYYYGGNRPTQGLVRFILDDFDELKDRAYGAAIADARARAGRLARLSGSALGPVVGVREVAVPGDKAGQGDDEMPRIRIESSKFQEIPVRVELQVRFEAEPPKPAKAAEGAR